MPQFHIAVIVGSLRHDSFNKKLAMALPSLAPADFSFTQAQINDLPLYNQDDDPHQDHRERIDYLWLAQPTTGRQVTADRPRRWGFPRPGVHGGLAGTLSDHLALSVTLHLD